MDKQRFLGSFKTDKRDSNPYDSQRNCTSPTSKVKNIPIFKNIFVAGSKKLINERHEISYRIKKVENKVAEVVFRVYDFKDFNSEIKSIRSKQDDYNSFIADATNYFIAIIDGDIGKYTLKELEIAVHSESLKKSPLILVYCKNPNTSNPYFVEMKKLLHHDYYEEYTDCTDLGHQIESKFHDEAIYIRSLKEQENAKKRRTFRITFGK